MDLLTQALMQRELAQPQTPVTPPASTGKTHTPPEIQRFANAQRMIQSYRNNWTPNPILQQVANR